MLRRGLAALVLLLAVAPARAQDAAERLEPVVVTATRTEQRLGEAPASVSVLTREDIAQTAAQSLDDLLRQVPGFSLFRRSSSLVSHPTTQGVSLRGIGPSGASRALVLLDGLPLNDPFGGWVYWDRVPLQSVEQVEVVRGGGASVWGNYALGGVINIITRRPTGRAAFFEGSYGTNDTRHLDLLLTEALGPVRLSLEGNHFSTNGYKVVSASRRGAIDVDAGSEHLTFNGRVDVVLSPDLTAFVRGTYYEESRDNGTPLQFNHTDSGSFATGLRARTGDGSEWTGAVFTDLQQFRSTFSTQATDRNSETLALDQRVPSTAVGAALSWTRAFGAHRLLAGADFRWIDGETDERVYVAGAFARTRVAGGEQQLYGLFLQDAYRPIPMLELVAGIRGDYWRAYNGFRRDTPAPAGIPARQTYSDIDRIGVSPRVAAVVHATSTTDVRASAYQGFRVPTINELYRVFRVRADVTVANEHLKPERLTGGEVGAEQRWGPFTGRATAFWNEVEDLVANVTLTTRLPDCPAGTTCRQRQNLDRARIRGVETELELRPARDWRILAGYVFSDAEVLEAPQQRTLEGKRLAQVPRHGASVTVRYDNPALLTAAATVRFVGRQFEDDLNTLPLGSYALVDLFLSRRLARWAEIFVGIENLLDTTYRTGRTSEGVVSIGAPFQVHGGVRLTF
ncbi:MAG TPA: TonB-dependent receptor [Methylomirabilota bacterium]|nr:TonB-dependent receptor [Methylomirabilota bacterium]